jgi:ABC-type lipoprotein release transport system permease subunit
MNVWVAVAGLLIGLVGSLFGAYLAVREMLARLDERHKAMEHRLERHSNRLVRLEDSSLHHQKV